MAGPPSLAYPASPTTPAIVVIDTGRIDLSDDVVAGIGYVEVACDIARDAGGLLELRSRGLPAIPRVSRGAVPAKVEMIPAAVVLRMQWL